MLDRPLDINGKHIIISQDLSLSHAGTVWDGALTLVYYWEKNKSVAKQLIEHKRVLELGSGTGIVGLTACAFSPTSILLTDLQQYLPILIQNTHKNISLHCNTKLTVQKLKWNNQIDMNSTGPIDTIIGSQLAYDKQNVIRLMQTIKYYKQINPQLQLMISYQKHKEQWKNLEYMMKQYFGTMVAGVDDALLDEDYQDQKLGILYFKSQ